MVAKLGPDQGWKFQFFNGGRLQGKGSILIDPTVEILERMVKAVFPAETLTL